ARQCAHADGNSGSATVTVHMTISHENEALAAVKDAATAAEDTGVSIPVLPNATDPDGDTLAVTVVSPPAHGSAVARADGTITYTPAANYNGADSFTYTIADGHGGTATATVDITSTAGKDAPEAASDAGTTAEENTDPIG